VRRKKSRYRLLIIRTECKAASEQQSATILVVLPVRVTWQSPLDDEVLEVVQSK
jgi:hypothetical protein